MYFEHKALYRSISGPVPDEYYETEIGKARLVQEGDDVTIITYGAGVAGQLVADLNTITNSRGEKVAGKYVEPVQLQIVCSNIWKKRPKKVRVFTQKHLGEFGNVDHALRNFYDQTIKNVLKKYVRSTPNVDLLALEDKIRGWFGQKLITDSDTRRPVFRPPDAREIEGLENELVDAFVDEYILRPEQRGNGRIYEIAHDRFIRAIRQSNTDYRVNNATASENLALRRNRGTVLTQKQLENHLFKAADILRQS